LKRRKVSVKWILFGTLFGFAAALLIAMWLLQTVYLDTSYKSIKKKEISNAMDSIVNVSDNAELNELLVTLADDYDICVLITDENGSTLSIAEANFQCAIHKWTPSIIKTYIKRAEENDGSYQRVIEGLGAGSKNNSGYEDQDQNQNQNPEDINIMDKPDRLREMPDVESYQSVIYVKMFTLNGTEKVAILNSIISPVDATVRTIRVQLMYVSFIIVVVALILAIFISKVVSKPIIKLNTSAKELAKGNFDIRFEAGEYREIEELSNTLNHAAIDLGKAEKLQEEIIANVSHDLRTPLTMIVAYSEVMRDLPGENSPENVQVVIDEALRLTNLVNDLLDISKIQSGVTTLELKEYNLTDSIRSVIDRYGRLVEQDGYKIIFDYKCNVLVEADEFKMYQVMYNLISNAINYTGADKKVIVKQKTIGSIVRIEVIDTGEGIPEKEIENVWERYYKVDKTHKRAIVGTGLGLSIVKNVLKLHKATYGINSEIGKGSIFWFELKIKERIGGG